MLLWAHPSSNPKWHLDQFSRFCTANGRASLYFTTGRPSPLKIAPSHGGYEPPFNIWFLRPSSLEIPWTLHSPQPKRHLKHFSHFCTTHGRASLYFTMGRPSPSKLPLPMRGSGPYLKYTIPWAHQSPKPKWHLDCFSHFFHKSPQSVPIYFTMSQPMPIPMGIWTPI